VILRQVTVKGPRVNGVELLGGLHDVVVEKCDISGWGENLPDGWGHNMDAGVVGRSRQLTRIIVQRNKIHDPRSNSNDWSQVRPGSTRKTFINHPFGPQAIVFYDPLGNNVLRYNEVYGDESHRFNDGIGGNENFSFKGFPGVDSDVYGNWVRNPCDDALEIEGGGCNIRVWGNYLEYCHTGPSSAAVSIGPLYIFRNVLGVSRYSSEKPIEDPTVRGVFGKVGDAEGYGGGRRYYFHNTVLQPKGAHGALLGAGWGIPWSGPFTNTVSRNNILHVVLGASMQLTIKPVPGQRTLNLHVKSGWSVDDHLHNGGNDLDYDLCNGAVTVGPGQETHVIRGVPVYADPDAANQGHAGNFTLAASSPGYHQAEPLANFNAGPNSDFGAQQSGEPPLEFGVHAYEATLP
jgi:hypothetical protein